MWDFIGNVFLLIVVTPLSVFLSIKLGTYAYFKAKQLAERDFHRKDRRHGSSEDQA